MYFVVLQAAFPKEKRSESSDELEILKRDGNDKEKINSNEIKNAAQTQQHAECIAYSEQAEVQGRQRP